MCPRTPNSPQLPPPPTRGGSARTPLRVSIVQPSLARYRVPVYRALAREADLDIQVLYGTDKGIPNVSAEGFSAQAAPHRHLGVGRLRPFVWQPAHLAAARREMSDVLLTVWNTRWISLLPALRRARQEGVRVVLWGHGYSKNEAAWRRRARWRLGEAADAVLFYSQTVADRYRREGFPPEKIFVAPNSLDQTEIQASRQAWLGNPAALTAFRDEHRSPAGATILYVSRLSHANRVDLLIDAIAIIAKTRPDVRLHVVGKGEPVLEQLKEQVARLGLASHVSFPGAIYGEEKLAPWFLSATVFCYPHNVGLSLHHAMGYGLPVVTCDDGDIQNPEFEALADGVNGRVFRRGDAEDLARTLLNLINSPDETRRMGDRALHTATQDYGIPAMVQGMAAAIRGHIAGHADDHATPEKPPCLTST